MKSVYFITGKNSVGKTTFIKNAVAWDSRHDALYPGQECRKKFGELAFAKSDQPEAPDFSEKFVRDLVNEAVSKLLEDELYDTLYVDGFPRRIDQVEVTQQIASRVDKTIIYYCVCEEEERKRRQKLRDPKAQILAVARDVTESTAMLNVVEACVIRGIPMVSLDLTQNVLQVESQHPLKGHLLLLADRFRRLVKECDKIEARIGSITFIPNCHRSDRQFEEKWLKSEFESESFRLYKAGVAEEDLTGFIAPIVILTCSSKQDLNELWTKNAPKFDRITASNNNLVLRLTAAEWLYMDSYFSNEITGTIVKVLADKLPDLFEGVTPNKSSNKVTYEGKVR